MTQRYSTWCTNPAYNKMLENLLDQLIKNDTPVEELAKIMAEIDMKGKSLFVNYAAVCRRIEEDMS